MNALLLAPHHDDETLFASFLCQRYRPLVVTVLQSQVQEGMGISNEQRKKETLAATRILGCEWQQWPEYDHMPDWEAVRRAMVTYSESNPTYECVFAPMPDPPYGHEHHDVVGQLALEVFGFARTMFYTTYRFGGPRTVSDTPVPYDGPMLLGKLKALACYESQILKGPRRFFAMALDEYTVKP